MLAQNEQVVVKMRLARGKIERHEARLGTDELNRSVGTVFSRDESVIVSHSTSITLPDAKYGDSRADTKTNFRRSDERSFGPALRNVQDVASLELHVLGFLLENFAEVQDRKSTRLNSSHRCISYAVFCLKKKKTHEQAIL